MSMKDELFFPGWWKYAIAGFAIGIWIHVLCAMLCGCTSAPVSEPSYPEYDKWWTGPEPRRSANLSELGQGDVLVFDNGLEATLL